MFTLIEQQIRYLTVSRRFKENQGILRLFFRSFRFFENPVLTLRTIGVNPRSDLVTPPEQFSPDPDRFGNFSKLVPGVPRSDGHAAEFGGFDGWQKNTR